MTTTDQDDYVNDPSSRISPQGDILDYLIWDRLSKFWSSSFRQEDRQALNGIYESIGNVLDAEMVRLGEINDAKSIFSAPVLVQRRWARLDLNRYAELKAFLAYALCGVQPGAAPQYQSSTPVNGTAGAPGDYISTMSIGASHAAHWHINFSWTLIGTNAVDRRTINLQYPTHPSLIEIWRMSKDGDGRITGEKIIYGLDFTILGDGTSIRLTAGVEGDVYDVVMGFNFSDRVTFDGRLPVTSMSVGPHPGIRSLSIAPELSGFPVHVQVVRNPPPVVGTALQETNNEELTTVTEFSPYTGNVATGVTVPTPGVATFPVSLAGLSSTDVAYTFGLERVEDGAPFTRLHSHEQFHFLITRGALTVPPGIPILDVLTSSVTTVEIPEGLVPLGINNSIDFLGQELRLFVDGRKLHRSEYIISAAVSEIVFRIPLTISEDQYTRIDVQYTREFEGLANQTLELHNHVTGFKVNPTPVSVFGVFDDGGDFDYDSEETVQPPFGVLDSAVSSGAVYLADVDIDEPTLRIYQDGVLLVSTVDYVYSVEPATADSPGRGRIVFAREITHTVIELTYRKAGSIISYGVDDIFGGQGCAAYLTPGSVDLILGNIGTLLMNFTSLYGPVSNPEALIDAIRVMAAGGNPFLTLFGDEFNDYQKYSIDAAGQSITAASARSIESANTQLAAIPVLVDHPHRPTIRLIQGQDFDVVKGSIASSTPLTSSRGADDMEPGVWWCPVLYLDESTLAKTFGNLVGDVRAESTVEYKNALIGNHLARWSGPVSGSIQSAASIFLGSPIFQQDGRIVSVQPITTSVLVTVHGTSLDKTYTFGLGQAIPSVGTLIFAGQSIASPLAYQATLATLKYWTGASIVMQDLFLVPKIDDLVWIEMFSAGSSRGTWVRLTVSSVQVRHVINDPGTVETVVTFKERVTALAKPRIQSRIRISRPADAPYADFDGIVDSVTTIQQWQVNTSAGETHLLPPDTPLSYHVGQEVRRGDAVVQNYATLYDEAERSNWHWLDPKHDTASHHLLNAGKATEDVESDQRYVTIKPGTGGYSRILLSRIDPIPPRGTKLTVTVDGTGVTETYIVAGNDGVTLTASPLVSGDRSGLAVFDLPPIGIRASYFEIPVGLSVPSSSLTSSTPINSPTIQLLGTSTFPPAGRVGLQLAGGCIEVEYYHISGAFLVDLNWINLEDHDGLRDPTGRLVPTVPICRVVLLAEYTPRILNPAMASLITRRVVNDTGTGSGAPRISASTVDTYYDLFKNNSAVLELNRVGSPAALRLLLDDVVPPSTTLVTISTHVICDVYQAGAHDG